ncbi:CUZD1 protein, partial [Polyodon spathula]|nr:CUZD1 protein [Polyodon spathula]
ESDVECTDTTMTLYVSKSSVNGFNETNLRLNDPSCLVTTNGSHIIASVSLNSCGTQVEETVDEVIFRNEITSFDNPYDVITREHRIEIPFTCKFSRKSRLSASFEAHKSASFSTGVGFGNFTYLFEFYDSSAFRTVIDPKTYPIKLKLKDMIYMGIKVRSSLSNIRLFVESCRATPHDNPNDPIYYDIITNGCTKDKTTKVYSGSPKEFRFGLQAFSFIGNYEQVYISCTVLLCGAGDNKTRCAQGCTDNYNRRKRSMVSDTQRHFISQGPLRLVENSSGSPGRGVSYNVKYIE